MPTFNKIILDSSGSVSSSNLASNIVTSGKLATGAVTNAKIGADAVDGTKIADDSIDSEHIVADSLDSEHYAPGSVDRFALGTGQVRTDALGDEAVTSAKIYPGTIATSNIADSAISSAKIASSAVTTAKIASDAITNAKIADDSIDSEHYVDRSIDTDHLQHLAVTTAKLADSNVTTAKIANDAVTNDKVANDAIRIGQIDTSNSSSVGQYLQASPTAEGLTWVSLSISNNNWSGTDLAVVNGGTGASTASSARTNLGLGTSSSVEFNELELGSDLIVNGQTTFYDTVSMIDPLSVSTTATKIFDCAFTAFNINVGVSGTDSAVTLGTPSTKNTTYITHTNNTSNVTLKLSGEYRIVYAMGVTASGASNRSTLRCMLNHYSSGNSLRQEYPVDSMYIRSNGANYNSGTMAGQIILNTSSSNDYIQPRIEVLDRESSGTIPLNTAYSSIQIYRVTRTAGG